VLPDGQFGAAEETGRDMNAAIVEGDRDSLGMGEALGRWLVGQASACQDSSLLAAAYRNRTPVTVHVAIGTDTPHTHRRPTPPHRPRHPSRLPPVLPPGFAARFRGVYLNLGSAVIMPEVFLKAVSVVRNLGNRLEDFTTVNLDFLQHYRPRVNVIERPHTRSGGRGIALTGHHELMVPLLAAALIERQS